MLRGLVMPEPGDKVGAYTVVKVTGRHVYYTHPGSRAGLG